MSSNLISRFVSLILGLALVAILAYWGSKLLAPRVAIAPVVVSAPPGDNQESAFTKQLFGNPPSAVVASGVPAADARLQVLGVVTGSPGVAIITVDGNPAKPYGVGQTVSPGVVVRQVLSTKVIVTRDGVEVSLPTPLLVDKAILTIGKASGSTTTASGLPASVPLSSPQNAPTVGNSAIFAPQSSATGMNNQSPQNNQNGNASVQQTTPNGDARVQENQQNPASPTPNHPVGSSMRSNSPPQ